MKIPKIQATLSPMPTYGFSQRRGPSEIILLIVVMLSLTAACTTGDPDGNTTGDPDGNTTGDPDGNTTGDPDGNTTNRSDSPADGSPDSPADEPERLSDYLGMPGLTADPEQQQAFYIRQEQQIQESIADCMIAEGFEYIPAVQPPQSDSTFGGADSREEYAREKGFGITTEIGRSIDYEAASHSDDDNKMDRPQ